VTKGKFEEESMFFSDPSKYSGIYPRDKRAVEYPSPILVGETLPS